MRHAIVSISLHSRLRPAIVRMSWIWCSKLVRMSHHLAAAVVSNDASFLLSKVQANTVNGTTYAEICARTTGAPRNRWFGPVGDPRDAGVGTS